MSWRSKKDNKTGKIRRFKTVYSVKNLFHSKTVKSLSLIDKNKAKKESNSLFTLASDIKTDRDKRVKIKRALVSAMNQARAMNKEEVAKIYEDAYKKIHIPKQVSEKKVQRLNTRMLDLDVTTIQWTDKFGIKRELERYEFGWLYTEWNKDGIKVKDKTSYSGYDVEPLITDYLRYEKMPLENTYTMEYEYYGEHKKEDLTYDEMKKQKRTLQENGLSDKWIKITKEGKLTEGRKAALNFIERKKFHDKELKKQYGVKDTHELSIKQLSDWVDWLWGSGDKKFQREIEAGKYKIYK